MNLNGKQIIGIIAAVLSVLAVSTAQLTDIFGPGPAKAILSVAGLANAVINSILVTLNGQGSTVREVLAMPGVEKINVNAQANKTLADIAVDPTVDKISPTPAAQAAVTATANGA